MVDAKFKKPGLWPCFIAIEYYINLYKISFDQVVVPVQASFVHVLSLVLQVHCMYSAVLGFY